ncbi:hypothetical protein D3C71_1074990 [compost metagenome]
MNSFVPSAYTRWMVYSDALADLSQYILASAVVSFTYIESSSVIADVAAGAASFVVNASLPIFIE